MELKRNISSLAIAPHSPKSVKTNRIVAQMANNTVNKHYMAQSAVASRKTSLHIDVFWEKATITPPVLWNKWTQQLKLALLAKDGIQLETVLNGHTTTVTYPSDLVYEKHVEIHTKATERDKKLAIEIKGGVVKQM